MVQIPDDKRYFRIGEVSRIIGVEPYVLRYWETEFPQIRPQRASSRQRTYQRQDLELVLEIKRLLYEEKLTIEGARQRLRRMKAKRRKLDGAFLQGVEEDLRAVLRILG